MNAQTNNSNTLVKTLSTLFVFGMLAIMALPAQASGLEDRCVAAGMNPNVFLLNGPAGIDMTTLSIMSLDKQPAYEQEAQVISTRSSSFDMYSSPLGYDGVVGLPHMLSLMVEEREAAQSVKQELVQNATDPVWEMVKDSPEFSYDGAAGVGLGLRTAIERDLAL